MTEKQTTLFDLEAFTYSPVPNPVYDPFWDELEPAPEQTYCVREQVKSDTKGASNLTDYVREQVKYDIASAPEHTHWLEEYWVQRCGKKHKYYRYCWMHGRKIQHCHIGGGNVRSQLAIRKKQAVEEAIADGQTPQEIKQLLRGSNSSKVPTL